MPNTPFVKKVLIECFHALLMFLFTIPFYLYGGNVLYGNVLFSIPDETMALINRAAITVLIVEILFNWVPIHGFRLTWWRERWLYVILSGFVFSLLAYFVVTPQFYEGEATIGMGIVWTIGGAILHLIFRRIGWYKLQSE